MIEIISTVILVLFPFSLIIILRNSGDWGKLGKHYACNSDISISIYRNAHFQCISLKNKESGDISYNNLIKLSVYNDAIYIIHPKVISCFSVNVKISKSDIESGRRINKYFSSVVELNLKKKLGFSLFIPSSLLDESWLIEKVEKG